VEGGAITGYPTRGNGRVESALPRGRDGLREAGGPV